MDAVEWLEQIKKIDELIELVDSERQRLWAKATRNTSSLEGAPYGSGISDKIGDNVAKMADLDAEKKELEELEESRRQQEMQRQKIAAFQETVAQNKAKVDAQKGRIVGATSSSSDTAKLSVKEQMELLQQIKSLMDAGVLTQDEFEKKKQEILNS